MAKSKEEKVKVFLSCPKDVIEEAEWVCNFINSLKEVDGVEVECFCWIDREQMGTYPLTKEGHEHVDENCLPSECDIFYALFANRFGELKSNENIRHKNPLPNTDGKFRSGTEYEIYDALHGHAESQGRKPSHISILKIGKPIIPNHEEISQLLSLSQYLYTELNIVTSHFNISGSCLNDTYKEGSFKSEFESQFRGDLKSVLLKKAKEKVNETLIEEFETSVFENYLQKLIKDNSTLELTGFGRLSSNPYVELEQVFVALKADKTKHFEISQTQELNRILRFQQVQGFKALQKEEQKKIINNDLKLLGLKNLNSFAKPQGKSYRFDEVIKELRWSVILGDPGGGKTTLVRWLTLKMSKSYTEYLKDRTKNIFQVPKKQIDPDSASDELVDLGKVRLPILIQVAHYATWADERRKEKVEGSSIWDYLGYHQGPRGGKFIQAEESVRPLLTSAIRKAEAIIILDGMDEIPQKLENVTRQSIAEDIKVFKENYLEKYNQENSVVDSSPFENGGNQLIVTSRITGYETAVVSDLMHLIIQPMSENAVKRFCDLWINAVNKVKNQDSGENINELVVNAEIQGLINAIYNHQHKNIQELASNPLLLTVIALVYDKDKVKKLPERRTELYQQALEILTHDWRNLNFEAEQVVNILAPLAAFIHTNYPDGCIGEYELKKYFRETLGKEKPELSTEQINTEAKEIYELIEEKIGLLYERGDKVFAFLHLTFQEYLAGLALINEHKDNPDAITDRIYDPRWREPILLSLGYVGWKEKDKINDLVKDVLESDKEINYLVPQGAFIIIAALANLEGMDTVRKRQLFTILLESYSKVLHFGFNQIQTKIELCFLELRKNKALSGLIESSIVEAISKQNLAASTSILAERLEFLSERIVDSIMKNLPYDSKELNFPMQNILRTLADCPIPKYKTPKPVLMPEANLQALDQRTAEKYERYFDVQNVLYEHQLLIEKQKSIDTSPLQTIPIRMALENKPFLVEKIKTDIELLKLSVAFYGGYTYFKREEIEKEYAEIADFLVKANVVRDQLIEEAPAEYLKYNGGYDDCVYSLAVYLDTEMQRRNLKIFQNTRPLFSPTGIFKSASIETEFYNLLTSALTKEQIVERLEELLKTDNNNLRCEACIFLMLLGEDISDRLFIQDPSLLESIIHRLESIKKQLQDTILLNRNFIWKELTKEIILDQRGEDILLAFQQMIVESSLIPVEFV